MADKVSVLRCHGSLELRVRRPGSRESSQCISSLASGALKRWADQGGDVGRRTRAQDCQRRNKKEGDMIKNLPRPPSLPAYLPAPGIQARRRLQRGECKHFQTFPHERVDMHVQLHVLKAHAHVCFTAPSGQPLTPRRLQPFFWFTPLGISCETDWRSVLVLIWIQAETTCEPLPSKACFHVDVFFLHLLPVTFLLVVLGYCSLVGKLCTSSSIWKTEEIAEWQSSSFDSFFKFSSKVFTPAPPSSLQWPRPP